MKKIAFLIILMSVVLVFTASWAGASNQGPRSESVTISASKDNTLYEDNDGVLSNGFGAHFFSGRASGTANNGAIRRGLIAFDSLTTVVPAGSLILGAELILHMSRSTSSVQPVALHKVEADWGEAASDAAGEEGGGAAAEPQDATWLHTFYADQFWQTPGGDFAATPSAMTMVGGTGSYTWSGPGITGDVRDWLVNPDSNYGWVLLNESSNKTTKRFDSRENSTAEFQPKLLITFLPREQVEKLYMPVVLKN
ncbi:MAG: DNRLRE domain-containing protein [Chloroflexi bacterium]|nr:DNRLRE domain-containing protein [Chloroflexota bacterium]